MWELEYKENWVLTGFISLLSKRLSRVASSTIQKDWFLGTQHFYSAAFNPYMFPGKPLGWWNLVGYSPWGRKESDTTERLHFTSLHILQKTLESPLDCKQIQPVCPKGNHSWVFFGGTDAEAETPVLWPPDAKNWLIGIDPDVGKDEGRIGTTEDEMVRCHHQLDGHKFEQASGVGDGQGSLACCSSCSCRVGYDWATELTDLLTSPYSRLGSLQMND